jgi:hypothetical protein
LGKTERKRKGQSHGAILCYFGKSGIRVGTKILDEEDKAKKKEKRKKKKEG